MAFPTYAQLTHQITVQRGSAVQRTEMDDGMAKQARRFSRVLITRNVEYLFASLTDYNNFIAWFEGSECRSGALFFFWNDPADGDTPKLARIVNGELGAAMPDKQMESWSLKFQLETWG